MEMLSKTPREPDVASPHAWHPSFLLQRLVHLAALRSLSYIVPYLAVVLSALLIPGGRPIQAHPSHHQSHRGRLLTSLD